MAIRVCVAGVSGWSRDLGELLGVSGNGVTGNGVTVSATPAKPTPAQPAVR